MLNDDGTKIILKNKGYTSNDDFYKAKGNYSCFKTCNSWVNTGFKESGLTSCLWTPFDFGLLNKYQIENLILLAYLLLRMKRDLNFVGLASQNTETIHLC